MTDREWQELPRNHGEEPVEASLEPEETAPQAENLPPDVREERTAGPAPLADPQETENSSPAQPQEARQETFEQDAPQKPEPTGEGRQTVYQEAYREAAPQGYPAVQFPQPPRQPGWPVQGQSPYYGQQPNRWPPQRPAGYYYNRPVYPGQTPSPPQVRPGYGYPGPQEYYYQPQQGYQAGPPQPSAPPFQGPAQDWPPASPTGEEYSQPQRSAPGEEEAQEPVEKKKLKGKTKAFLWLLGIVLFGIIAFLVVYTVGNSAGWFTQGEAPAEPPEVSASEPENPETPEAPGAPEIPEASDAEKYNLALEETPQGDMLTPNQVYEKNKNSVMAVVTYGQDSDLTDSPISSGSGIVLTEDGYIVTNSHVVLDSNQYSVKVVFTDHQGGGADIEYPAKVVGYDRRTDIAVLKIDATGLTPAEFADSEQLKVGDTVLSLGNPGISGMNFTNTLTKGMVSAVGRSVAMSSYNMEYIQTDTAINPGSSGGALLNLYGQVVGINAAKITNTNVEGICFAIPISLAKEVIDDIINTGYVSGRVRMGVTIRSISAYEAQMYNVPQGLVVVGFAEDSSLPGKGVETGDIITAINGKDTTSSNILYDELEQYQAGDTVTLDIYRQAMEGQPGRTFQVQVVLMEDKGETQRVETESAPQYP